MNDSFSPIQKYFYDPEGTLSAEETAALQEIGATKLVMNEPVKKRETKLPFFHSLATIGMLFNL